MKQTRIKILLVLPVLLLVGCQAAVTPPATRTPPPPSPTLALTPPISPPSSTPAPPTATISLTPSPSPTATVTATTMSTPTGTPTPVPTYVKLRGEVIVEQAVCHYGPGKPYLYKYGVVQGSNLEIIGRVETADGPYLEVQAIGGNNPCWVNAKWMRVKGDLANVEPIDPETYPLPMSPYYGPPSGISARRDGNDVTVFWNAFPLRAGDDSEQVPYLVEAWVCRAGKIVFTPVGSYQTAVKLTDEAGCAGPSHGRMYAVEKHGYTRYVEIPWPPAQ